MYFSIIKIGGDKMDTVEKQVIKMGNSAGIYLPIKVLFASGISVGDKVELKCSKGKITLIKINETEEK
jgi:antitoxin component of MazEF toxin-antitoxin module